VRKLPVGAQLSIEERTDWVRLDWNENPYPPSPVVRNAVHAVSFLMNEYAPLDQSRIIDKLCAYLGGNVKPENIVLFGGAGSALGYAFRAFLEANPMGWCMAGWTEPNYGYLPAYVIRNFIKMVTVPDIWEPSMDALRQLSKNCNIVYVSNPMAQTGMVYDTSDLVRLKCHMIVDEVYAEFSGQTILEHWPLENTVVVRSFSKSFSLAGLRIGYVVAPPDLAERMRMIKDLEDVSIFAYAAAEASLTAEGILAARSNMRKVGWTRDEVLNELALDLGYNPYPSRANFVTFAEPAAEDLRVFLAARKVLVRTIPDTNRIRMAVRTPDDMRQAMNALKEWNHGKP